MSEYVHRVPVGTPTGASGAPSQENGNSGSGIINKSLTVNNAVVIAAAARGAKQVVSTLYGATVGEIGNAQLERRLALGGKIAGYIGIATFSRTAAAITIAVDAVNVGVKQVQYQQKITIENEYKKATSGVNTSLGGYYG